MIRYGLPYMGSKNSIAKDVVTYLPKAKNLYDLFAGGCAITHCAMLSGKWENIIFNDINGKITQLFMDAVNGKYHNERRWISREDFLRLKGTDEYVSLCWSFGNSEKAYLYGKDIEPYKKALWVAIFDDDYTLLWKLGFKVHKIKVNSIKDKYSKIKQQLNCHCLESLQSLQRLQRSYDQVEIKENSTIYCDIPYEGTAEYSCGEFNHKKFYDWACNQTELCVISSYNISDTRFQRVVNFKKHSLLSGNGCGKTMNEGLFIPKKQIQMWRNKKCLRK